MYRGTGKISSLYRGVVNDIGGKQSQLSLYRGEGNKCLRINPDIEVWWEKDRVRGGP